MSKLYLMRHGQTLFNVLERIQGWCDSPLTELGQEQARQAGAWLHSQNIPFDHAYASTAERACDTLELAMPGMPYERVKGLRECYFGKFEGQSESLNPQPPYGDFFVQFGGERDVEVRDRMVSTITELMRRPEHENVLMVSHAGASIHFMEAWTDPMAILKSKPLGNCCVAIYDFDGDATFSFVDLVNPV